MRYQRKHGPLLVPVDILEKVMPSINAGITAFIHFKYIPIGICIGSVLLKVL